MSPRCLSGDTKGSAAPAVHQSVDPHPSKALEIGPWLHSFFDPGPTDGQSQIPGTYPKDSTVGVLTQNVRGFKQQDYNQDAWMAGWKATVQGRKICNKMTCYSRTLWQCMRKRVHGDLCTWRKMGNCISGCFSLWIKPSLYL
jgi:hypothetical protein